MNPSMELNGSQEDESIQRGRPHGNVTEEAAGTQLSALAGVNRHWPKEGRITELPEAQ